jgi:ABC-type uncharacterized transport system involved in gliding motility auxiliary subunit
MNNSNELLLLSLKEFYSFESNVQVLLSIINGNSKISLRLIDWFITNYSKNIKENKDKNISAIYQNYRAQLKAYKKIKFDPFRRRQRITFFYNDYLNTTIGQLNFFKWAIENNILEYISSRLEELEELMNIYQKNQKKQKEEKCMSEMDKDKEITKDVDINSLSNKIKKQQIKISTNRTTVVSFD